MSIAEQLTYCTVRLEVVDARGGVFTGTGFFYQLLSDGDRHVPVIITNRHVVDHAVVGRFHLTLRDAAGQPQHGSHVPIELDRFAGRWIPHPDPTIDLVAMPIAALQRQADAERKSFYSVQLTKDLIPSKAEFEDLGPLEDVVMVGYPNGIWDSANNSPILRRGVTATHPRFDYEGRPEFMIDAACFPGSSGSPVFLYNVGSWTTRAGNMVVGGARVKLLGVLYAGPQYTAEGEVRIAYVPTGHRAIACSALPLNLGLVIRSNRIHEFEDVLRPMIDKERQTLPRN